MPFVKIDLLEGKSAGEKEKLMMSIYKAFEENGIPKEWVSIVISDKPVENWGVAGKMLSEVIAEAQAKGAKEKDEAKEKE